MILETVKIKLGDGFAIINETDFDKSKHELFEGEVAPVADADADAETKGTPETWGTDSGDQFSDDQMRDAIFKATGNQVSKKIGREKLIERFNALNEKNGE